MAISGQINQHPKVTLSAKKGKEAWYTLAFIGLFGGFIGAMVTAMGAANFFSTLTQTAYRLLMETALYIVAVSVVMGAFGSLLSDFGIVAMLNRLFAPLMKPLYNLPGASFLAVTTTYLSDNPAVITLAKDKTFIGYFKEEDIPLLCNLGTAFGMGLILTTFMTGFGFFKEAMIGNLGAVMGSVVSVRIMAHKIKKSGYFTERTDQEMRTPEGADAIYRENVASNEEEGSFFLRFMTSLLNGGKNGIEMSMAIIPGLIVVCTAVMLLTFGPADAAMGYQGLAYEGIGLLPKLGELMTPVLTPLFGFSSPEAIAFPFTSLGAVGAAISLVPKFLDLGLIGGNDIAVFTAMGMCWSGYLSTHVGMMDALSHKKLIGSAIFSHTVGGLVAGIGANLLYHLL